VEARSRKPTRIAMQEVLAEAVSWEIRDEKEMAAAAAEAAAAAAAAAKEA
jgi:hypothetical protein